MTNLLLCRMCRAICPLFAQTSSSSFSTLLILIPARAYWQTGKKRKWQEGEKPFCKLNLRKEKEKGPPPLPPCINRWQHECYLLCHCVYHSQGCLFVYSYFWVLCLSSRHFWWDNHLAGLSSSGAFSSLFYGQYSAWFSTVLQYILSLLLGRR